MSGASRLSCTVCVSLRKDGTGLSTSFSWRYIEFVAGAADPCLYILKAGEVILLFYVDDILLTGKNKELVCTVIEQMKERFETVNLGDAKFVLGMSIQRNRDAGTLLLSQKAYIRAVLAKFGMADVHAI